MDQLLELFHSNHDDDLLGFDLHMLQDLLVITPSSKNYADFPVMLHKYGGTNVAVEKFMSHFYMFVPTKATVKLANETWDMPK